MSCSFDCFSYVSLMSGAKSGFCFRAYLAQTRNVISQELSFLKINVFNVLFAQIAFHPLLSHFVQKLRMAGHKAKDGPSVASGEGGLQFIIKTVYL